MELLTHKKAEFDRRKKTGTLENETLLDKYLPVPYLNGERKFKIENSSEDSFDQK